jgi:chorismate mutase
MKETAVGEKAQEQLEELRSSIDNLDAALVYVMAERFRLTDQVGQLKAAHQLPAVDARREEAQFDRIRALARSAGLDPEVAVRLLKNAIGEVVQRHIAAASHWNAEGRRSAAAAFRAKCSSRLGFHPALGTRSTRGDFAKCRTARKED